jgi:predicted transcriptional regulator
MICYDTPALQTFQHRASTSFYFKRGKTIGFRSMNYRDKTDISVTILELANGGASKSKIISTAFLNHSSSLQYFKMLLKNKLLVYQEEKRMFKTTPAGIQFLQLYHLMSELVM